MHLLIFTALVSLIPFAVYGLDEDYCFGKDTERLQTRHFSTKTAYQIIKGTHMEKQYLVPGCVPEKIWIFHRHGTRLPEKSIIERIPRLEQLRNEIVKNYRESQTKPTEGALCQEDLIALKLWKWNSSITPDQENYLTSQGYDDLRGTAKLYQKFFPEIMPKLYQRNYYRFQHTATQRTHESFKAFTEGLFGADNEAVAERVPEEDLLLRPYDFCDAWKENDYSGPDSESYKYRHSELWNTTINDISKRLGFLHPLGTADIELMYDICRYEQAWQVDRTSVWCSVFRPDNVTVFEYGEDLMYYYKSGYGNAINERVSCRLVQDMLENLNSQSMPHAVVYFGHSAGLQTFLTALGINKDEVQLTADNYNKWSDQSWISRSINPLLHAFGVNRDDTKTRERRWEMSNVDPFAANFVAVKYQCDNDVRQPEKVMFFLNQNALELDGCQVGLCDWSDIMLRYEKFFTANCDEYYCGAGAAATVSVSIFLTLIAALSLVT